ALIFFKKRVAMTSSVEHESKEASKEKLTMKHSYLHNYCCKDKLFLSAFAECFNKKHFWQRKGARRQPAKRDSAQVFIKTENLSVYIFDSEKSKWVEKSNEQSKDKTDNANTDEKTAEASDISIKTLQIISFNVWFSDHTWKERQKNLLQILKKKNADIICLQEVTPRFMPGFCEK
ncbi:hypothetical protein RFI_16728, partial [Reticulomyxa filosa]